MTEENGLRHDERGFLTGGRRLTPQQEIDEPSADLIGMRSILERIGRGIDRLVRLLSAKAVPAVPVARRGASPQRMAGSQHGGSARMAAAHARRHQRSARHRRARQCRRWALRLNWRGRRTPARPAGQPVRRQHGGAQSRREAVGRWWCGARPAPCQPFRCGQWWLVASGSNGTTRRRAPTHSA